jgi:hypothetical protein
VRSMVAARYADPVGAPARFLHRVSSNAGPGPHLVSSLGAGVAQS